MLGILLQTVYFIVFHYSHLKDSYVYNFNPLGSLGVRLIVQFDDRTLNRQSCKAIHITLC